MDRSRRPAALLIAVAMVVAACSGGVGGPAIAGAPSSGATALTSTPPAGGPSPTAPGPGATDVPPASSADPSPAETPGPPVLEQAWATADLVDAATGTTFRIADLAGRVVIIETMAIWCTNCRTQQRDVYTALQQLDPAVVAFVGLDVDPSETTQALATYRERNGFTGTYAVAGRAVARALAAQFGDQILSPPSTPMIIIGSDGRVTLAGYGHKSVDELLDLARDHGA